MLTNQKDGATLTWQSTPWATSSCAFSITFRYPFYAKMCRVDQAETGSYHHVLVTNLHKGKSPHLTHAPYTGGVAPRGAR